MKKVSLFVLVILITVLGAGTASFAKCSSSTFPTGSGIWGIEIGGSNSSGYDNILMQVTFTATGSGTGTYSGTQWEAVAYGGITGSTSVSGTWSATTLVGCEYTMKETSTSRTYNFTLNSSGKGGTIVETTSDYTSIGIMAAEGTVTCSDTTVKNKQYSLYSQGYISGLGLVTGTGEILFSSTGTTFGADATVTLDLGAGGNLVLAGTGSSSLSSNCQGSAALTTAAGTFDVDTVVVDAGKEVLWIVTNTGENVSGYFLE